MACAADRRTDGRTEGLSHFSGSYLEFGFNFPAELNWLICSPNRFGLTGWNKRLFVFFLAVHMGMRYLNLSPTLAHTCYVRTHRQLARSPGGRIL